jgi:hypothetical protein
MQNSKGFAEVNNLALFYLKDILKEMGLVAFTVR